ncbi:hypothetical protein TNCV_3738481 [Trichonephila clavipes]|nr:hypothetical protein TNCV_3738481 [Trichonephila clavipes]
MVEISVALQFRIHSTTEKCLIIGFELIASNCQSLKKFGRPRVTADRENRLIAIPAVTAPDPSLLTIRRASRTRVPTITIHRQLAEQNLHPYQTLRHMPITPAHCRDTLLNNC